MQAYATAEVILDANTATQAVQPAAGGFRLVVPCYSTFSPLVTN